MDEELEALRMSSSVFLPDASLLSFQLLNQGIIFVPDDDEWDIHGFIRKYPTAIVV